MVIDREKCGAPCGVSVHLKDEEIKIILAAMLENDGVEAVDDEEYTRRMIICSECESLIFNTTCRHCGCLVQVKAKLADSKCPYPYQPKW